MRFGSVCSGIEAASVASESLGWQAAWFSEIEPFPSAVLQHHYPSVPNLGDMTQIADLIDADILEAPDVLCGGTPCQAFSVAGLRKSLADARGNLSLVFCEIANAIDRTRARLGQPESIIFWENVPGVLSTADNAFGCLLAGLAGEDCPLVAPGGKWTNAGYVLGPKRAVAWRILDAQYFGVAQRRRRVFVVASARKGFDPAAVLFEFDGVRRDTAPSREAGQAITPCVTAGAGNGGAAHGARSGSAKDNRIVPVGGRPAVSLPYTAANCLTQRMHKGSNSTLDEGQTPALVFDTTQVTSPANYSNPQPGDPCHPLAAGAHAPVIAFQSNQSFDSGNNIDICPTLRIGSNGQGQPPAIAFPANLSGTQCASSPPPAVIAPVSVSLRGREGGATAELGDEVGNCLRASSGGGDKAHVLAPVATFQQSSMKGKGTIGYDDSGVSKPVKTQVDGQMVHAAMQVRRLTPEECERLQGFPTVSEKITIEACLDPQNRSVHVALKCLRWQNSVSNADENELTQPAKTVDALSSTGPAHLAPLAALHVRMHSVDELLEIRSAGRLIWSASGAGQSKKSLPPTLTENSVQELARMLREVGRTVRNGKAASPPSISLSFPDLSGGTSAGKSGQETVANASGAMSVQSKDTFTTSDLGLITTCSDSIAETLCCSALHAIAGCIPSTTLPVTFSIELTVETPYTLIPWRKKPAADCPDGPRYKALGNSWAVPVVRWIFERINRH